MTEHTELTAEQVVLWLTESMNNARHIASSKVGKDRDGWLDDARHLKAAIDMVAKANLGAGGAVCVGEIIEIPDDHGTRVADWNDERYKLPAGTKLYAYATPSTAQEVLPDTLGQPELLGIASAAYAEGIAEGGPALRHFVRAIKAGIRAHCLALRGA